MIDFGRIEYIVILAFWCSDNSGDDASHDQRDEREDLNLLVYPVSAILDYNAQQGYFVEWAVEPPGRSWVLPADMAGCLGLVLLYHGGDWTLVPEPLQRQARRACNPQDGGTIDDVPPVAAHTQRVLLAACAGLGHVLRETLENTVSLFPILDLLPGELRQFAKIAADAVTDPAYFTNLLALATPGTTVDATVIGDYFHKVLGPCAGPVFIPACVCCCVV